MRIGMIGTGRIGFSLGPLLVRNGHEVKFGSRNPELVRASVAKFGTGASVGTVREAAQFGDMLFTAVPWHTVPETLRDAGPLKGKVVVDCTNPLTSDMGLAVGCTASAAEETAKLFPEAIVVKGFNTIFAAHYLSGDLGSGEQRLNMFFRGDDVAAKKKVGGIIESLGLIPVDAGPLSSARYIEPLGVFMVRLAFVQGMGIRIGWKLVNYTSSVVSSASAK